VIGGIQFVVMGQPVPKARARTVVDERGHSHSFTPSDTTAAENWVRSAFIKCVGAERVGAYKDPIRAKPATRATKHQIALPSRPGVPGKWLKEPTFGKEGIIIEMDFYFRGAPIADGDNCEKLIWDALNRRAWRDDNRIMDWHGRKFWEQDMPRTVVRIKRVGDPGVPCSTCKAPFTFRTGPGDDAIVLHPGLGVVETRYIHARCI
jgi:hypothetical protein